MDDIRVLLVLAAVAVGILKTIRKAIKNMGEAGPGGEDSLEKKLQRELDQYARRRRVAPDPAPPAPPPPKPSRAEVIQTVAIYPEAVSPPAAPKAAPPPPRPRVVQAARTGRAARKQAAPARMGGGGQGPATPAKGIKVKLNARSMARVAILSEIWRAPVALRREEPWERF